MLIKILYFCLLVLTSFVYSQGEGGGIHEIYTQVEGGDEYDYGKFIMYKNSAVWFQDHSTMLPLTDDFDTAMACDRLDFNDSLIPNGVSSNDRYGIFHTASFISYFPSQNIVFANGKYELIISHIKNNYVIDTFTLFLDYTVDNYNLGSNNDIWIKFIISETNCSVKIKLNSGAEFEDVSEFESFSIAEMKNFTPSKQKLEDYLWMYNINDYPHLEWNPYHDTNITEYNVYRKITTSSGSQTYVEFTTDTFYTDYEFTLDPKNGDDFVEYWVKAQINQNLESLESNHRSTEGISEIQWKEQVEVQKFPDEFELEQNYPNPFNPNTLINYSIKETGLVQLKVYDILGKEVAILVNENKEVGNYSVNLDASQLPSGIYIYQLTTPGFTQARKMVLTK